MLGHFLQENVKQRLFGFCPMCLYQQNKYQQY